MTQTIWLALLAGAFLGNGLPHFIRGITNEEFPCKAGNGPLPNFFGGWASLVIIGLLISRMDLQSDPMGAFLAGCGGLLVFGYLHASGTLKKL